MQVAKYYFDRFINEQLTSYKIEENQPFFKILKIVRNNFDKYWLMEKENVMIHLLERIKEDPKEVITIADFNDILEEGTGGLSSGENKIYQADIDSFRGIKSKQSILFHDPQDNIYKFNIFYGKNGSGKTTICELLEYGLTGTIKEASKRGYIELTEYLCGVEGLQITTGKEIALGGKSFDYDRFIFEKNRIEDFGRLKSQKREDQKNILSSLFGFEELEDFLARFNEQSIAQKINSSLKNEKSELNKKLVLEFERLDADLKSKTAQYNAGCKELGLTEPTEADIQSKMEQLESEKAACLKEKQKMEQGKKIIFSYNGEFAVLQKKITDLKVTLDKIKAQVSSLSSTLIQIFKGIKEEKENLDNSKCPICETPIKDCVKNHFENAESQLITVKGYLELQAEQKKLEDELKKYYEESISSIINNLSEVAKDNFFDKSIFTSLLSVNYSVGTNPTLEKYEQLYSKYDPYQQQLLDLVESVKVYNQELDKNKGDKTKIEELDEKIKKITEHNLLVGGLKLGGQQITQLKQDALKIQTQIDALKVEIEKENQYNEALKEYPPAYLQFTRGLKLYKDNIVEKEQQTIEKLAIKYYNTMNKGDEKDQKLIGIQIQRDGIKIKFDGAADHEDVLKILSEGHIKCLGLALLFSRAKKFGARFLIFDDIINAIDTDHRDGLIDLLLDNDFSDIQFIITTHDRFFDEKISNDSRIDNETISRYSCNYTKSKGVEFIPTTSRNYQSIIDQAIKDNNLSIAISTCRKLLEEIIIKNEFKYTGIKLNIIKGKSKTPDLYVFVSCHFKDKLKEYRKITLIETEVDKVEEIRKYFTDDITYAIVNQENHAIDPEFDSEQEKNTFDINIDNVKEIAVKVKELFLATEELIAKMKKNNISF